ncbi:MAG TPA: response regulator [Burkholderiales bacterium]|nr:response regulator [Burkholderiales bacterium]
MLGVLARLRARLASRTDTEHEQALVRLVVGAIIVLYLLPGAIERSLSPTIVAMLAYLVVGLVIFLHVVASPGISAARRVLGVLSDVGILTWVMAFLGERAAALFLLYVWITLANGFRFGQRYLVLSLLLSVGGFSLVLGYNDYWQQHRSLGYGLLIGFAVLSLYVRSLVTKLFDALARAEAANQAKRRFISVISHEMRTPLNAIIGMADLLRETTLNREQADMLQTMRSSSRVMLGLVEDVLDFSKIEAGKLVLEKTDFDVHALVNSTCRILATQAASKGLEFVVSIMPEVPPALHGDPYYLRQIIINLAGNAIKFTERGSVTVHVSMQGETERSVRLKFSIRDTGIGIAPEAQTKIFESFTQADQSTTRRFGGTGLGTTIAKQLVVLMGGKIGLESAVGLGTTFWFELDVRKQPERAGAGAGELAAARVMLVGFPDAEREALEAVLCGWGVVAISVPTVEQGAGRLVEEISLAKPYHSVLAYGSGDIKKLAQRFRRSAPQPTPPMVLATPSGAEVERFEVLSAGFAAVLQLPVDKRLLFNVLHSVAAGGELSEGVVRLQDYARRSASGRKLRVLVADDNPTNREVVGKILERGGHAVTLVSDGEEALDALEQARPDIVLLDRNMPRLGGLETLQAIRLLKPSGEHLPVVMFSADVTPEAKREALEAGCDAFLAKPIEALRLLEEVHALTSGRGEPERRAAPAPGLSVRAPTASGTPAVVNGETLAHLEELGSTAAFVEKLVSVFLADNGALMERMERAVAGRNYQDIRSLLHAMKGSSASMGTDRLTALCTRLGRLSDAEMRLQANHFVQSLRDEIALARAELESYLQAHRQSAG